MRVIVAAPSALGLLLFSAVSYAGDVQRTVSFEVTNTFQSVLPDAATVDCTSIQDCTFINPDPLTGAHQPAIRFQLGMDQTVHVEAGIWGALACMGDPDAVAAGDLALMAGMNIIRIVFTPPLDDGTPLSLRWALGACPLTACGDYASLGCEPPTYCNPPM